MGLNRSLHGERPAINGPRHGTADKEVLSLNVPKRTKKKHETSSGRDLNQEPSVHRSIAHWNRGAQILQKFVSHLKIPCARWATWSKLRADDPPILDNTTLNLFAGRHGPPALCTPAVERHFRWFGWSKGWKLRRSSRQPIYLPKIEPETSRILSGVGKTWSLVCNITAFTAALPWLTSCPNVLQSSHWEPTSELWILLGSKLLQESALWCGSGKGCQLIWRKRYFLTGGTAEDESRGKIIVTDTGIVVVEFFFCRHKMSVVVCEVGSTTQLASVHAWNAPSSTLLQPSLRKDLGPFSYKEGAWGVTSSNTRVGTLIVATIYLQLVQNRYMFRSFTVLQCSHQHRVQPVASHVEVVGYL